MIELLCAFQVDQDRMPAFIRVVFTFFFVHVGPHFFTDFIVLKVYFSSAIKPGNTSSRQQAIATASAKFWISEIDGDFGTIVNSFGRGAAAPARGGRGRGGPPGVGSGASSGSGSSQVWSDGVSGCNGPSVR